MIKTKEFYPTYLHSSVTVLHPVAFLVQQALGSFQKLVDILQSYKQKTKYDICVFALRAVLRVFFISYTTAEDKVACNGVS